MTTTLAAAQFTVTAPRTQWREALAKLLAVVPTSKLSLPVATCVLVEAHDGRVVLRATDFETTVVLTLPCDVSGSGAVALPAKRLSEIVASLPAGVPMSVAIDGAAAKIRAGRSSFDITGMGPDEFPAPVTIAGEHPIHLSASAFLSALTRAARMSSNEESRPIWNTVAVFVRGTTVLAVATDGKRLVQLPAGTVRATGDAEFLIANDTIPALARLLGALPDDATITLVADGNRARFEVADLIVTVRLVDGRFPPYEAILRQETTHTIVCGRESLIAAVKRVALVTDAAQRVMVTIPEDGSALHLTASSPDAGTAADVLDLDSHIAHGTASEFTIALHSVPLVVALEILPGESVSISFGTPTTPIHLRSADQKPDDPTLALVMPLVIPAVPSTASTRRR